MDKLELSYNDDDDSVTFIKSDTGLSVILRKKAVAILSGKIKREDIKTLAEFLGYNETSKSPSLSEKEIKDLKNHYNMAEGLYSD